MERNYWTRMWDSRTTRRRAILSTTGASLGAAFLAACGGDNSTDGGSKESSRDRSGLLTAPQDTTEKAVRGGTLNLQVNGDPASLDVHQNAEPNSYVESVAGRLISLKGGYKTFPADEPDGDMAESWEVSPDLMTLTLKLRQGLRWHDIAPVSGRAVDVDDILYSSKRYEASGAKRTALYNSANPDAPLKSITAPDSKTIVVKLAYPIYYGLSLLAIQGFFMVPKEGENQSALDLRRKMIGTGPFQLADYQPSVGINLKRNPFYWDAKKPYVNEIRHPVIPEYATALAQFKAGAIHTYPVSQEDVVATKQAVPEIGLFQGGVTPAGERTIFGFETKAFRDERVRQALSMSWDRDLWIDVFYNADKFEAQGLPIEKRWNTAFTATDADVSSGAWLDPRSSDFGENGKYFKHNVAEAKKLLAAAGFPNGMDGVANYAVGSIYTAAHKKMQVLNGFEKEAGFNFTTKTMDYNTEFIPIIRDGQGKFEGTSWKSGPSALSTEPVARLAFDYSASAGVSYYGFDSAGKGDGSGDALVEGQIRKAQAETDVNARKKILHDLQRHLGKTQYATRWPGASTSYLMAWPELQNFRVWMGSRDSHIVFLNWWLDKTKSPQKS